MRKKTGNIGILIMSHRGSGTIITRRLQFDGVDTAIARVASCLCEGLVEVVDKVEDARASVAATLEGLWSALTEEGETVPRDAARGRAKKFKVFGEACKAACAGFMVLFKAFAVFCALCLACFLRSTLTRSGFPPSPPNHIDKAVGRF